MCIKVIDRQRSIEPIKPYLSIASFRPFVFFRVERACVVKNVCVCVPWWDVKRVYVEPKIESVWKEGSGRRG